MSDTEQTRLFGTVANCVTLREVTELIANNRSSPSIRRLAGAYGMVLQASQSVRATSYFEDSRYVVDQLARAKTEIDIAAWHAPDVVQTTAMVLAEMQAFLDRETIGSTEWPTPGEVSAAAAKIASDCVAPTHPNNSSRAELG
jgi:hypothetical protein